MESDALALGVDLGTGSARAFVFDSGGARMGGARLAYGWKSAVDGTVEAEPDGIVELVLAAMDAAVESIPPGAEVAAVGFSCLWHTILGIDAAGRPVTPVYAWNDTRGTAAAAVLRERLDPERVHARTGAVLHPSYPPAKLLWLREADPARFRRSHAWLSLPEYLWLRLTGDRAVSLSIAAGSGLLDQATLRWDEELLDATGVSDRQLGRVVVGHGDASVPGERVPAASRWPALRPALWRMPVGDGACANIGSGCHDESRIALGIGTSAALRVLMHGGWAAPPPGLWRYRIDRDRSVQGAAISNGGIVRSWLTSLLRLPAAGAELDALLAVRPPGAHALAVLPFIGGERSPDWPLHASAAISGLSIATTGLDILQAGMEAVAYRLAILLERMRRATPSAKEIVASGGALRGSPYWAELIADVLGEPVMTGSDPEASARGAALLALEAAGFDDAPRLAAAGPHARIEPDPTRHRLHAAALERHLRLEERLR